MKTTIEVLNFDADRELLKSEEQLFGKLEKYHDRIVSTEVYMKLKPSKKTNDKEVEVRIYLPGHVIYAFCESNHFMSASKNVFNNVKNQLVEYQNPQAEKHARPHSNQSVSSTDLYFRNFGFY
jgi:putative sigma-54 modulation protein